MTARTITIPAPEWRDDGDGEHTMLLGVIRLCGAWCDDSQMWRITWSFLLGLREREPKQKFPDLPSAKAWAEKRALELLGVKG